MQNYTESTSNVIMLSPKMSARVTEIRQSATHTCQIIELNAAARDRARAKKLSGLSSTIGPNDRSAA